MAEVWKKIEGWNEYSVSSLGNVRRDNFRGLGYSKILILPKNGMYSLSQNGKKKSYSSSTLIRENFKEENNPREIWKKIEEYTNYSVSNFARVRNDDCGRIMTINIRDKDSTGAAGYCHVCLTGETSKNLRLHRLVALAFIPNPNNYPCVNHIDGNKENNCIENLEWCTQLHNYTIHNLSILKRNLDVSAQNQMIDLMRVFQFKELGICLVVKIERIVRIG